MGKCDIDFKHDLFDEPVIRVINWSVLVWIHGGSGTVKEEVEPDPDP